uniref:Uncharacterized protein n=1 Tax=Palpitomonas bilix TaxID=652834 RepID=A0A7S3G279_9EUKA|mmetsp:Transcript_19423/g.49789  ORF Transcript_19423/g.49789 Transcript_19423/m.49789 type:complete len:627 (+) Transcript_19423:3-1883(+)
MERRMTALVKTFEEGRVFVDKYGFEVRDELEGEYREFLHAFPIKLEKIRQKWGKFLGDAGCDISMSSRSAWRPSEIIRPLPEKTKSLRTLVRAGIPPEYRAELWMHFSGAFKKRDETEGATRAPGEMSYYARMLSESAAQNHPALKDIQKDLDRTYKKHPFFNGIGYGRLKNVLLAYAIRNKSVGYCQSMNYLAALLLLYMDEEDAFWTLCTVVEDTLPGYYDTSMSGCHIDQRVFEELATKKMGRIMDHLKSFELDIGIFTLEWFLCLFSKTFPSETVFRLWDCFFYEGKKVLFRFAFAAFKYLEHDLLRARSAAEVFVLIQSSLERVFDAEKYMNCVFENTAGKLSDKQYETLRGHHEAHFSARATDMLRSQNVAKAVVMSKFNSKELNRLFDEYCKVCDSSSVASPSIIRPNSLVLRFHTFQTVFGRVVHGWAPNTRPMLRIFELFDKDNDGLIDFSELVSGLSLFVRSTPAERWQLCFQVFDLTDDGYVSYEEMMAVAEGFCYADEEQHFLHTLQRVRTRITERYQLFWKEEEETMQRRKELGMEEKAITSTSVHGLNKASFCEFVSTEPILVRPFNLAKEQEEAMAAHAAADRRSGGLRSPLSPSASPHQRSISLLPVETL